MFRVPDFQHDWTVNFYISHLPLKGKAMATKPRKRIPLRVALLATIIGLICTLSLFGETSQAASSMEAEACEGKGCVECDNSTQECPEPPAPTPEPSPTPTPEPPAQSFLAKTGTLASTFAWIAIITFAIGWGAWNKSQQKRCV